MTEYGNKTLDQLWSWVANEREDDGFTHVKTLYRQQVALEQQRDNLRVLRDRLVEGWPPDRSEAADAFVRRINAMIEALGYTASSVGTICVGVDHVYATVRDARRQLQAVKDANPQGGPAADQMAREIMVSADATVSAAAVKIKAPLPEYARIDEVQVTNNADGSTSGSPGSSARSSGSTHGGTGRLAALQQSLIGQTSSGENARDGSGDSIAAGNGGYSLAGEAAGQSSSHVGNLTTRPPDVAGGTSGTGRRPGAASPILFNPGVIGPGIVIGAPQSTVPGVGRTGTAPVAGTATRPASAPGTRRQASGRQSVSGPTDEPRGTGGGAGSSGGLRDRSFERYAERRRAPRDSEDGLWVVAEGVPPLIEATADRPHDPGPGVLGIDR